ncbi:MULTISPECIES: hypothetical protein [Microbacterium]|uniref:hypothetical protein n=1 Tax=Microbacterium TaxID=33882 RepID=UPI00277F304D|nr:MULTISPECIES: hypothetical protein [Microbacterium]MDQ1082917.1 hypothetical protein [Microbacterium sp. SORGH_AS_0344]MDQ1168315.1 hypothetical protein [Microbacterium proteolyticum]
MSDDGVREDDPDDVTLWAGRLRAWPVLPPSDDDDATIRSRRGATRSRDDVIREDEQLDDAGVSRRAETRPGKTTPSRPADPTADAPLAEIPTGATGEYASASPDGDTVPSGAGDRRAREHPGEADADVTVRSRRAADAATASAPHHGRDTAGLPDDPHAARAGSAPTDAVAFVRAIHPGAAAGDAHDQADRAAADTPPSDTDATDTPPAASVASHTAADDIAADDTAAGARLRRRDGFRAQAEGVRDGVREAHVPAALQRETYAPRVHAPVRVSRAPADPTTRVGDAASVHPRRARGGGRLLVLAVVSAAVVALAVVGVVLLLG